MFIATVIARELLTLSDIGLVEDAVDALGLQAVGGDMDDGVAIDFSLHSCDGNPFEGDVGPVEAAIVRTLSNVDVIVQLAAHRRKRLLVADMDSTMITVECIDELADYAGLKPQVADVTDRAMRGELDFEAALDARVRLLAGLDEAAIDRCREERVRVTPGARALVRTMRAQGAYTLLVSGGFTRFAEPVADAIGFDRAMANVLIIENGKLTGAVRRPIVGAAAKREALLAAAAELGIGLEESLAVGDGANDVPMIEAAGLGVAYRAKPALAMVADARIDHSDLTALLYAQGYARSDWAGEEGA